MLSEVRRTTYEQSENFNKGIENIKEHQTEITLLKNTVIELKKKISEGIKEQTRSFKKRIKEHENRQ